LTLFGPYCSIDPSTEATQRPRGLRTPAGDRRSPPVPRHGPGFVEAAPHKGAWPDV